MRTFAPPAMHITDLPDEMLRLVFVALIDPLWEAGGDVALAIDRFVAVNKAFRRVGLHAAMRFGANRFELCTNDEIRRVLCVGRIRARIDMLSQAPLKPLDVDVPPQLEELEWRAFNGVARVQPTAGGCAALRRLSLCGVEMATDLFGMLTKCCPNLERLYLFNVRGYGTAVAPLPKLADLTVNLYGELAASVASLFRYGLPALTKFRVGEGDMAAAGWPGLHHVFDNAPMLECLSITDVVNVMAKAEPPRRPVRLQQLILTFVEGSDVVRLLPMMDRVRDLDVSFNSGVIPPEVVVVVGGLAQVAWEMVEVASLDFCQLAGENVSIVVNTCRVTVAPGEYRKLRRGQLVVLWISGDAPTPLPPGLADLAPGAAAVVKRTNSMNRVVREWEVRGV